MKKEEANKRLEKLVSDITKSFDAAEAFADKHGLSFSFYRSDTVFDDTYKGKALVQKDNEKWYKSDPDGFDALTGEWQASGARC